MEIVINSLKVIMFGLGLYYSLSFIIMMFNICMNLLVSISEKKSFSFKNDNIDLIRIVIIWTIFYYLTLYK